MSATERAALAAIKSFARKGDAKYSMSLFRLIGSSTQKESK